MFSATYEHSINDLVQSFLRDDFVQIQIGQINSAADTVEQTFLKVFFLKDFFWKYFYLKKGK